MKKPIIILILLLINVILINAEQREIKVRLNVSTTFENSVEDKHFNKKPELVYESSSVKARKLAPFFIVQAISLVAILFVWGKF